MAGVCLFGEHKFQRLLLTRVFINARTNTNESGGVRSFVRAVERLGTLCSPGSRSVHVQFTKGRTELDDMNTTPDAQTLHTLARIVAARTRARPAAARASPYSGPPESSSDLSAASSRSVASNLARLLTQRAAALVPARLCSFRGVHQNAHATSLIARAGFNSCCYGQHSCSS